MGSSFTSPGLGASVRATSANLGQGARVKREIRVRKPEVFNLEGSNPQAHTSEEGVLNKGFGRSERVGRVRDRGRTQRAKATKSLERGDQVSEKEAYGYKQEGPWQGQCPE